ncbi:hypothetical protein QYE76_058805 [Lolium multiflorum]|uniref:Aminotransferase-like plant mobile domain-containing protein n=1 Tax=Lolium multiflorum TaxID=4521 RepID=A0AAD8WQB8_LOLMU|nr:hypothetical protein QYE76_058805 [Lolium multiflorum]
MNGAALTALVDRWRPETHTFHFRAGEMTPTLQDVSMIIGLPIQGETLCMNTASDGRSSGAAIAHPYLVVRTVSMKPVLSHSVAEVWYIPSESQQHDGVVVVVEGEKPGLRLPETIGGRERRPEVKG